MPPKEIAGFSDDQMAAITDAARPLHPHDRGAFVTDAHNLLRQRPAVSRGEMIRVLQELQRQYLRDEPVNYGSKWSC
jgi:hypothetical protein